MKFVALVALATLAACAAPMPPPMWEPSSMTAQQAAAFARTLPIYRSPDEMIAGGQRERIAQAAARAAREDAEQRRREAVFCRESAGEFGVWTAGRNQEIVERQCLRSFERTRALLAP